MTKDPSTEIDNYINALPDFSKALCTRLRALIKKAAPGITEDWKWGPHYNSNGMVCGFGGFKKHVVLHFFNGSGMSDSHKLFNSGKDNDYGRSIKFNDITELKEKEKFIIEYVRESVALNKSGFKRTKKEKDAICPEDLYKALRKKPLALKFFESLANGYKNEFIELVEAAKRQETREQRVEKVVTLCGAQTKLNDKYKK
ncbi:MAG TPA: YdeI/OmpD-associated family protein [Cyclobacteriaceae bacterium]|nr:YdeI/OmpD-associated family protein [Cyclobacteriaceae bacterium]